MTSPNPRRRIPAVLAACALLALAGCGDGGGAPAATHPTGRAATVCQALQKALPDRIATGERADGSPEFTAAWGDPAIALRCGVPRPKLLTPGTPAYDPTSEAAEVNGVSWLIEQREGGHRFTTTDRVAYVEVDVPDAYAPEIGALTDFGKAVRTSVPTRL